MLDLPQVLNLVYRVFLALIFIRILLAWVPDLARRFPAIASTVIQLTSPILDPIRRLMPPVGGLDLSPIVALLLLQLVKTLLEEALSLL